MKTKVHVPTQIYIKISKTNLQQEIPNLTDTKEIFFPQLPF